jgi:hypothetical protein
MLLNEGVYQYEKSTTDFSENQSTQKIHFSSQYPLSRQHLVKGWSGLECWGVWSEGSRCRMFFRMTIPDKGMFRIVLFLKAFVCERMTRQNVKVLVNDELSTEFVLEQIDSKAVVVAGSVGKLSRGPGIWLDIDLPDAASPHSLGVSDDQRVLGIGLEWIEISFFSDPFFVTSPNCRVLH